MLLIIFVLPAARILPNWSQLRQTERLEAVGKSPTSEILWSWAQKNKTVGDLLRVLEDMGHERALDVFRSGGEWWTPRNPCVTVIITTSFASLMQSKKLANVLSRNTLR